MFEGFKSLWMTLLWAKATASLSRHDINEAVAPAFWRHLLSFAVCKIDRSLFFNRSVDLLHGEENPAISQLADIVDGYNAQCSS